MNKSQTIGNVVFVKSPLFNGTLETLAVIEKLFQQERFEKSVALILMNLRQEPCLKT